MRRAIFPSYGEIVFRSITFEPRLIDEWNCSPSVCLVVAWLSVIWHDLWPQIGLEVKFWNRFFHTKLDITRFISTRKHDGVIRCSRTTLRKKWTTLRKDPTPDSPCHYASSAFCGLKLPVLVGMPGQLKRSLALLAKNDKDSVLMTSFGLEYVHLRSRTFH